MKLAWKPHDTQASSTVDSSWVPSTLRMSIPHRFATFTARSLPERSAVTAADTDEGLFGYAQPLLLLSSQISHSRKKNR